MSPLTEAKAHLRKATEFLTAAEQAAESELVNAAASNAVTSGINSKDAICLVLTGTTGKSDSHTDAIAELRSAGSSSKQLAGTTQNLATVLGRLMRLKNKSQYQSADVARSDALKAVGWAQTMLEGAEEIVLR